MHGMIQDDENGGGGVGKQCVVGRVWKFLFVVVFCERVQKNNAHSPVQVKEQAETKLGQQFAEFNVVSVAKQVRTYMETSCLFVCLFACLSVYVAWWACVASLHDL
jgi:uncharacterized ion transporter superfamily protein YfcC